MIAVARSGAPTFFAITRSSAHEPPPRMMRIKATPAAGKMLRSHFHCRHPKRPAFSSENESGAEK